MNQDVTAAVDVLNQPMDMSALTGSHPSPDALARLGESLAQFSSKVARREQELNKIFQDIAVERTSLLDAVLMRLFSGFSGVIPFDRVECAFLSDDGRSIVSYWGRTVDGESGVSGHTTSIESSPLIALFTSGRPRLTSDLAAFIAESESAAVEQRLYDEGARAVLTCPLVADGAPLGFLFFTSRRPHAFSDAHAAAFQRAATQVSIVVQKTRAYGEVVRYPEVVDRNRMLLRETGRLREQATTDALTGVMNRRALDAALASAWEQFERTKVGFGVILCDIDHFKHVNDTYGHAVGDAVLASVARCFGRGLRGADQVGRWGGEEFLVIVATPSEQILMDVAERLRGMIGRDVSCGISVTASLGAATAHRFSSLGDMLVSADRALYSAKAAGRNRSLLADESESVLATVTRVSATGTSHAQSTIDG
ncbi:MAG: sensor domain-containing diguanylate cyclase [Vicinamibacterales bacterium]